MSKHKVSRAAPEMTWVAAVAASWNELAQAGQTPSAADLAAQLATRLQLPVATASGLLAGFQGLVSYAQQELTETRGALVEERASVQVALQAVRPVLEARLQQRLDQADEEVREVRCTGCGQLAVAQGRRVRGWQSLVGPLQLKRRYGWCEPCQAGRAPAQAQAGLPAGPCTAGLEEVTSLMATTVPHGLAVQLVGHLLGLEVSEQAVKSSVERRAESVVKLQDEEAQEAQEFAARWAKNPPYLTAQAPATPPAVAYLEVDGVLVMTRQAQAAAATSPGGRGGPGRKYAVTGREVKNAILYTSAACAQESERRGVLLEKTYVSVLGTWLNLALLLWVVMLKQGFNRAQLLVVLSDGAEWIRSLSRWLPLPVLLILDLYHVKHKLWETAAALYGEGTGAARAWAQTQCALIEAGQVGEVLAGLADLLDSQPKAREQLAQLQTYLHNNQDRMDYPAYRAQGLRVGSGAIESTNYHVTGARLKLQGMRWSETGAAQMARLRADLFNGVWQARSQQLLELA